ncbi:MAG: type I-A CRISPR-associated protein Cas5a [Desulfurococcales archaeon]|nr:type I-A CRISPR-associated protein Cas5a [Desulfurococcales archaeon]
MPIGYKLEVEFNWGFSASVPGLAKTNPTYSYPPLTTVLGAISEVVAKDYELGESKGIEVMKSLSRNLLGITYAAVNYIPVKYQDINKVIILKSGGGKNAGLKVKTDAPARGKTIVSPLTIDNPPILIVIIVMEDENITCCNKQIRITPDILWRIHRIGSKESVVSVWKADRVNSLVIESSEIQTKYAFPLDATEYIGGGTPGSWEVIWQVDPYEPSSWMRSPATSYSFGQSLTPYMVPIRPHRATRALSVKLKVKQDVIVLDVDGEKIVGRRKTSV